MWKPIVIIIVCIAFAIMGFLLFNKDKKLEELSQNLVNTQITLQKSKNINKYSLEEINRLNGDLDKSEAANKRALVKVDDLEDELDESKDYTVSLESEIEWLKDTSEESIETSGIVIEEIGKTRDLVLQVININRNMEQIDGVSPDILKYINEQNSLLTSALESLSTGETNALGLDDSLRNILLKVNELEEINKKLQESLDLAEKIRKELKEEINTAKASEASAKIRASNLEVKTKEQEELIIEAQKLTSNSQLKVKELKFESSIFKIGTGVAVIAAILLGIFV